MANRNRNPFKVTPPPNRPKRNTFDLSYSNNLTAKIGKLIPVMCKEVVPGDTFHITPDFGLRFMPTIFPIQTRLRADLHFFYIRNRNLWDGWQKFIGDTGKSSSDFPVIGDKSTTSGFYDNGSLADYLGIPTQAISDIQEQRTVTPNEFPVGRPWLDISYQSPNVHSSSLPSKMFRYLPFQKYENSDIGQTSRVRFPISLSVNSDGTIKAPHVMFLLPVSDNSSLLDGSEFYLTTANRYFNLPTSLFQSSETCRVAYFSSKVMFQTDIDLKLLAVTDPFEISFKESRKLGVKFDASNKLYRKEGGAEVGFSDIANDVQYIALCFDGDFSGLFEDGFTFSDLTPMTSEKPTSVGAPATFSSLRLCYTLKFAQNIVDADVYKTYRRANFPVSALPFRAYRSIYNGHYRNNFVDPIIDSKGNPDYDTFVENKGDGVDNFPYELENRYWEDDYLTTCKPSPQQGAAPLVGVRTNDPTLNTQVLSTNSGDVTVKTNVQGKVVAVSHYDQNLPVGSIEALNEAISFGISISDFRNVDALQRWLEINQRRGFRYKEQIQSHYGVNVTYEELDMPEYIGGVSKDIQTSAILNTAKSVGNELGEFGGVASTFAQGKTINKYCDEHGFIMAILSIVPIPTYSQVMPKIFMKNSKLDFFFPEFGHIGYQPISQGELSPLQCTKGGLSYDKTFGYQRAFYEYLASLDESHGDFRGDLRNFLIHREFADVPILSKQFISIDYREVNNVFAVKSDTDKILGQMYFKISAERPIPFFGVPSLTQN